MKYRILASDMDGTMLKDDKTISKETQEAVRDFKEDGGYLVIASGRPYPAMTRYLKELEPNAPMVTYNGAKIVDPKDGRVLFEEGMIEEDAIMIMKEGEKRGHTVIVWTDDILYGNELNKNMEIYVFNTDIVPRKYDDLEFFRGKSVTKIILNDDPEKIAVTMKDMEGSELEGTTWATSGPEYLEFFSDKVSKAVSVDRVAKMLGLGRDEVCAVGDGNNDLAMIEYAGLGVAMENAPKSVRDRADHVTASNEEDGVAKLIRREILGK
ncbi:MAG: Cof-type HAD-IIB family hydrolase [Lachnospiraceae bacterium]|nr:Cof-type HAD-IIB family hydrolase [Lachnospiraceae bacterium]